ncbi:MAG TPA: membrane protein insertase YidC, partial [Candidatus Dormibacteraeota bacterium]
MKLYREHGISPFSNLTGCLPLLVQMPILYGLYRGIRSASNDIHQGKGFLWIGDVTKAPKELISGGHWSVMLLPVLAAAASFVQAKMMMQPPRKDMSEQELKMYSLSKNMLYLAPGMVLLFGYQLPVGLGIYWLTQSCVMLVQQWLVIGWGGLKVPPWFPGAGRVTPLSYRPDGTTSVSGTPPKRRPASGPAATAKERGGAAGSTRPASAPRGVSNGRAPRSVTSRAPGGAARPSQGSVRRRGRGR